MSSCSSVLHRALLLFFSGLQAWLASWSLEFTSPALSIYFHFLRSEAEILHNEAWRVTTSPLLTALGKEAQSEVIQGERKKLEKSFGMKNELGAKGLKKLDDCWVDGEKMCVNLIAGFYSLNGGLLFCA